MLSRPRHQWQLLAIGAAIAGRLGKRMLDCKINSEICALAYQIEKPAHHPHVSKCALVSALASLHITGRAWYPFSLPDGSPDFVSKKGAWLECSNKDDLAAWLSPVLPCDS